MGRRKLLLISVIISLSILAYSCDNRGSISTRQRQEASFTVDMTLVRNLPTGGNQVDVYFERDGQPFSDAAITVGDYIVPSIGGGLYFVESSLFPLPPGLTTIQFDSPEDDYVKSIQIHMPGDFEITEVTPRYNPNADDVTIEWSSSTNASDYVLAVATLDYPVDGTSPLRKIVPDGSNIYVVPDTTFENFAGDVVSGIYYIYLIAFNSGFGPYSGIPFPVPEGLPEKTILDPLGKLRYGTVADIDSIIVPFL